MSNDIYQQPLTGLDIAVFDLETTGLSPTRDYIIQIAWVQVRNGSLTGREREWKINPGDHVMIAPNILELTGLEEKVLRSSPLIDEVYPEFDLVARKTVVAGHNIERFDLPFIRTAEQRMAINKDYDYIDTCTLARRLEPQQANYKLATCAAAYGLEFDPDSLHDALADTRLCAQLLVLQLEKLQARGVNTFKDLVSFSKRRWLPKAQLVR